MDAHQRRGRPLKGLFARVAAPHSGTARVVGLTVALYLLGLAFALALHHDDVPFVAPVPLPWWLVAGAFFLTESVVIHLHIGRSAQSLSMTEVPLVFGLFFLSPTAFLTARMLGAGLALVVVRRQRPTKLAFNLSSFFLSSVVALWIIHAFDSVSGTFGPIQWLTAFGATFSENVIGVLAIAAVISLSEGRLDRRVPRMLATGSIVALTNTSLALLMITVLIADAPAGLLFAVPIFMAFVAYRAYIGEQHQHESMEMLYESTRILQRGPALDRALVELLDHTRKMFRAEIAEVLLLPPAEGGDVLRTVVGPGDERMLMFPIGPAIDDSVLLRSMSERRALFAPPTGRGAGGSGSQRFRNAIVAPLVGEARVIGTIVVADRLSDVFAFSSDDLRLLEAVANHTAVALENGQLEQSLDQLTKLQEELHHQAYHDVLTGLPNRSLFAESVTQRLTESDPDGRVPVVLFLDLDDFKIVNDSMGHAAGDALLNAVGGRIRSCLRGTDVAARLGGDEFAMLLWDAPDLTGAKHVADRLVASFDDPFLIEGEAVVAKASIGVATGRPGTGTGDELLRNADVAMYAAKAAGKGRVAYFEPSMAMAVNTQHEITASLQRAIAAQELVLYYQPVVDITSGRIRGAEALVRWNHPVHGLVLPSDFIRTAEQSDLILHLGRWVLARACQQLRAWQDRYPNARRLTVNVNVAGRQLAQPSFVDDVVGIVMASGVDPACVVLEMTESTLLADVDASLEKLRQVRAAGLGIAIDDFGTGYSSLSHLQRLPVTELKIARQFIEVEGVDPEAWALAEAIVAMGRALHLDIIAEGVERPSQLERLRELGCHQVQGFYFSRPLEADQFEELLANAPSLAIGPTSVLRPPISPRLVPSPATEIARVRGRRRVEDLGLHGSPAEGAVAPAHRRVRKSY
jgi:diguanylate cyclase (GGDEF)-like protein